MRSLRFVVAGSSLKVKTSTWSCLVWIAPPVVIRGRFLRCVPQRGAALPRQTMKLLSSTPVSNTCVSQATCKHKSTSVTTTTKTLLISTLLLSVPYYAMFVLLNQCFWLNLCTFHPLYPRNFCDFLNHS